MRRIAALLSVVALALLSAPAPGEDQPADGRELVREGEYVLTYFGQTLGRESFRIVRTEDGYEVAATLRMNVGDQPSSEGVYTLDGDRNLVRATYRSLEGDGLVATYERDGDTLTATARRDGEVVGRQRVELRPGARVTGPHYATDFFVLAPLAYEVGQEGAVPTYAFGFEGWRVHEIEMGCEREANRDQDGPRREDIATRVYRCRIETSEDTFITRSFLDERGVSVRITIDRFFGYVDVRLRPAE